MDYIGNFEWNGVLAVFLYWAPMLFCAVFYTVRTATGFMADKAKRDEAVAKRAAGEAVWYYPSETIGGILGRALVSVVPVANLWAALFDLAPKVFSRLFSWLGRVFDQPLVPPIK